MTAIYKTFDIEVVSRSENGGRIRITTGSPDRVFDRVLPAGGQVANYMANPVVQYGHNYYEPWATVGRTVSLEVDGQGWTADFELRPAANEADPQSIVRLLWAGGWIKAASIGFFPRSSVPNDMGGTDFVDWELLEWSLVPIPMNQEALAMAMRAIDAPAGTPPAPQPPVQLEGRVLSAKNRELIGAAVKVMKETISALQDLLDATDPDKAGDAPDTADPIAPDTAAAPDLPAVLDKLNTYLKTIMEEHHE